MWQNFINIFIKIMILQTINGFKWRKISEKFIRNIKEILFIKALYLLWDKNHFPKDIQSIWNTFFLLNQRNKRQKLKFWNLFSSVVPIMFTQLYSALIVKGIEQPYTSLPLTYWFTHDFFINSIKLIEFSLGLLSS
jgi:hypothetical protein